MIKGHNFKLHGLRNPEVQCHINKGSQIICILNQINTIPHIDTYFFVIHYVLPSVHRLSYRSLSCRYTVNILKALLPSFILATFPVHLNLLDLNSLVKGPSL